MSPALLVTALILASSPAGEAGGGVRAEQEASAGRDGDPPSDSGETAETPAAEEERGWWIPAAVQLQHAGNIGWLAAGPSWAWSDRQVQLALLFGHVPAFAGGPISGLAAKLSYWPFELDLGRQYFLRPLQLGGLLHYTFGDDYFLTQPDIYRSGYYDYSTALRVAGFVGAGVGMETDLPYLERVELYGELGATDLELFLHFDNPDSRPLFNSFHLAVGTLLWF